MVEEPIPIAAGAADVCPEAVARSVFERHYRLGAILLLSLMAAVQLACALLDSQVVDESYHLTAGYEFLKTGKLNAETEHPPLAQAVSALPLLFLGLREPRAAGPHYTEAQRDIDFVYHNNAPADRILLAARCVHILFPLALGWLLAWWMRRYFGAKAALAALTLLVFDPGFLAHGHYATTDVPGALGFFAACLSWHAFLRSGRPRHAALCGVAAALAMATKYSAILLFPTFVYLYGLAWCRQAGLPGKPPFRYSLRHMTTGLAMVALTMAPVLYVAFGFEAGPLVTLSGPREPGPGWAQAPAALRWVAEKIPIPAPSMLHGLFMLTRHDLGGHVAYLLGQPGVNGWWYYFPVVLAVKTPTGVLLLLALAMAAVAAAMLHGGAAKLRRLPLEWHVLVFPPLFYLFIAMRSHIDIGLRHILPLCPFAMAGIAAVLFADVRRQRFFSRAAAICLALAVVESAAAFPRYLAFFNLPSGGSAQGWRYVVDSNLDWGQDGKRLQSYVARRGIARVCLAGFSATPPEYYGFPVLPLPSGREQALAAGCVVAASITHVVEWPYWGPEFAWLAHTQPTDRVGDSFWIYDPAAPGLPRAVK